MVRVGGRILAGVSAALLGGAGMVALSASANAADLSYKDAPAEVHGAGRTLSVTGFAALTSDYIFRGVSQSDNDPAVQAQIDATYGILYAGAFASSTELEFGDSVEIDLYAGIKPSWNGVTFDLGFIYYAYPGADEDLEYWEVKAGVSGSLFKALDAYATIFYTDEGTLNSGEVITVEGGLSKTLFTHRNISFAASGVVGYVDFDEFDDLDYTYYNIGLTATFSEKYSLDVRYHDTDVDDVDLADERVVVTGKVSF